MSSNMMTSCKIMGSSSNDEASSTATKRQLFQTSSSMSIFWRAGSTTLLLLKVAEASGAIKRPVTSTYNVLPEMRLIDPESPVKTLLVLSFVFLYATTANYSAASLKFRRFAEYIRNSIQFTKGAVEKACKSTESAIEKVSSSNAISRIKSNISVSSLRLLNALSGDKKERTVIINAKESFIPLSNVSALALSDVKEVFRYAKIMNRSCFNKNEFKLALRPAARRAVDAVELAASQSRGVNVVLPIRQNGQADAGEMDALMFAAALRVFAEWRSLRLVPEGYQRYSVGMGLARRDLLQNAGKIETGVHAWIAHHEKSGDSNAHSPSLRELIQFEIDEGVHPKLPYLAERSAASGFLWGKRQLQYQTLIFANIAQIPLAFASSNDAVRAAYLAAYERYHGFFVRSMFQASLDACPDVDVILQHMNIPISCEDDASTERTTEDTEDSWFEGDIDLPEADDQNESHDSKLKHIEQTSKPNPFEKLGSKLSEEFSKVVKFFTQCGGNHDIVHPSRNAFNNVFPSCSSVPSMEPENSSTNQKEIPRYLAYVNGFIGELDCLINDMNLNDPSKV